MVSINHRLFLIANKKYLHYIMLLVTDYLHTNCYFFSEKYVVYYEKYSTLL